ncbi:ubiquinone biosynthesis protein UbiD [Actinophytocola xinjiangensis]|uniref:Pyrrole-2-carboxylic acid decarboxylase n=1 Tax=Actinophytocola xinjiangensis TaxID=485602 RepID=A0A7Z1B0V1_9PSEU|nr:UbiD family decarboxylase [Actinophytocola xinjiangensis]OLF14183.1 ubiquinone biosynthesis protein UbiD [Actinophytocola xinjiangensis]
MTGIPDLRDHLDALAALGDLRVVDEPIDPDLEVAAYTRHGYENRSPAPLFTRPACAVPGARLLGAPAALSSRADLPLARVALSLGLDPATAPAAIVDRLARVRDLPPVPPRIVADGPCQRHVALGAEADLDRWPVPVVHDGDGGPYVNTWGTIVVRTPDGSWTNWSISRVQKLDGHRMTGLFVPSQHLGVIWRQWADRGEPMPFALFQGGPPATPFVSSMPLARDVDEVGYLGAFYDQPVELVRCATVDLAVPTTAEVVIEGHVSPGRDADEGPFGEFPGYLVSGTGREPVYTITAITHRDDPVWPVIAEGRPVDDYHTAAGVCFAAEALGLLRAAGLPVTTVWCPFETANHWMVVTVPADWRRAGLDSTTLCARIGEVVWPTKFGFTVPKLFVLDDDVDPADPAELLWAVGTRQHPVDRVGVNAGPILPILACYTEREKAAKVGPRAVYDCLLEHRPAHSSFAGAYPAGVRERVRALLER